MGSSGRGQLVGVLELVRWPGASSASSRAGTTTRPLPTASSPARRLPWSARRVAASRSAIQPRAATSDGSAPAAPSPSAWSGGRRRASGPSGRRPGRRRRRATADRADRGRRSFRTCRGVLGTTRGTLPGGHSTSGRSPVSPAASPDAGIVRLTTDGRPDASRTPAGSTGHPVGVRPGRQRSADMERRLRQIGPRRGARLGRRMADEENHDVGQPAIDPGRVSRAAEGGAPDPPVGAVAARGLNARPVRDQARNRARSSTSTPLGAARRLRSRRCRRGLRGRVLSASSAA